MDINFNKRHLCCFAKNITYFKFRLKPKKTALQGKRAKARSY